MDPREINMDKMIETWKYNGIRYFGIAEKCRVRVVSETGGDFGAFLTLDGARTAQKKGKMSHIRYVRLVARRTQDSQ